MKVKNFVILVLCLLFYSLGHAQEDQAKVDSLQKLLVNAKDTARLEILRQLYIEYIYVDYQKAKAYLEEERELLSKLDRPDLVARFKNEEGIYYSVVSENEKALATFKEARDRYQELGDQERVSALLNNMSNCERRMGRYPEALELQMQSLKIKEELNVDMDKLSASYWNIGNITGDIGNYEESNVWYRKAEAYYDSVDFEYDLARVRYNIGLNLKEMDSLDQALPLFEMAMDYYEANNFYNDLAGGLDNIGEIYYDQERYDKAQSVLERSLQISEVNGEKSLIGLTKRKLGLVYLKQGKLRQAESNIKDALEIAQGTQTRKTMINDYKALAQVYQAQGRLNLALDEFMTYDSLKSVVWSEENIEKLNELEIKYQTEKKEKELALQDKQIAILKSEAATVRLQRFGLIAGILLLGLIFGTLYYGQRQKIQRQKLEREKLDAELEFKRKELTSFTLQLSHKNEILEDLKDKIKALKANVPDTRQYNRLINAIDINIKDDTNWENFKRRFEEVHKDFNKNIKQAYPKITSNELRLMALLKMNLSSKEIATLLNISQEGVKKARQRLRKKLALQPEMPLEDVVYSF